MRRLAGRIRLPGGIAGRIVLAVLLTAGIAVAVVGLGVSLVAAQAFAELMVQHGTTAEEAHAMFDGSVTVVLAGAVVAAVVVAIVLAVVLGARLARPLTALGAAARRIASGDYAARVPRQGPEEIASLADSFNQMAAALQEQERIRRDFIANAGHELRTPLTNLRGYLEAMRDGVIAPDRPTFESLLEEAQRLMRLSHSIDQLAEGDLAGPVHKLAEIDVAATIRSALALAAPGFERRRISVDAPIPMALAARADPDGLAQVLANLLQNASRYTPDGGHVSVRAERRPGDILVTVTNTGVGIPPDDLPHVFERFYRVDKSRDRGRGGAGIGLAIVQQIVEATGGRVGAESERGLTRFWFSIPSP